MSIPPDRDVPLVDAIYHVIEGTGTLEQVRSLLQAAEARHGVLLLPCDNDRSYMDRTTDVWIEQHLHPFLDETHLILAGGDFCNDIDLCDRDGALLGATWRDWGDIVATWANLRGWPSTQPRERPWDYMDFYMHRAGGYELEHYRDFARVVRAAIGVEAP